ncbi:MAG: RNA polymerase sigma factor [Planctomycetaceae bacterium]
MPSDIQDLVERCLAGDPAAVREVVEQFQPVVFARCLRMLGDRQDAEDAMQETLLRVVRNLHQWDGDRPLLPWILTIAANRCRTALARRRDRPAVRAELPEPVQPAGQHGRDLGEELDAALLDLRDEYQTVFRLFYLQEWSCLDIGRSLGVPEGTVKTWLHRARNELADRLRRRGVVSDDGYELHRF